MDKSTLIRTLHNEREGYEALLTAIGPERLAQPGVDGDYSAKDIAAHLLMYERWLVEWLAAALRGELPGPSAREEPDEAFRNRLYYTLNEERAVDDILAESRAVHEQLLVLIAAVSEADLDNPARTDWCVVPYWKASRPLWQAIIAETTEHYARHRPALEAWWRAGQPQNAASRRPAWAPRLPRLTRAPKASDSGD
jgi:hypothetical protein